MRIWLGTWALVGAFALGMVAENYREQHRQPVSWTNFEDAGHVIIDEGGEGHLDMICTNEGDRVVSPTYYFRDNVIYGWAAFAPRIVDAPVDLDRAFTAEGRK